MGLLNDITFGCFSRCIIETKSLHNLQKPYSGPTSADPFNKHLQGATANHVRGKGQRRSHDLQDIRWCSAQVMTQIQEIRL